MKLKCPACVKHIGSAVFVLVVLLLSMEAGLRMYDSRTGMITGRPEAASPILTSSWQTHHQLKPLVSVETKHPDTGEPVTVTTNSLGLRGPEFAVPKPPQTYRILVLGDDSTFAAETPQEETFCRKLERHLQGRIPQRVEVINAGVPGYCPLLAYLLLKHTLVGLQPDLVVLNFDMTDVADDLNCRRYTHVGNDGHPLICRHPQCDYESSAKPSPHSGSLLLMWAKQQIGKFSTSGETDADTDDIASPRGKYAWVKDQPPQWAVYIKQAFQPISSISKLSTELRADFLVAAIPAPWQVAAEATNTPAARTAAGIPVNAIYQNNRPFELLQESLTPLKIPYCNPVAQFRSFPKAERLFLRGAPRFSTIGHEMYSRELARTIITEIPSFRDAASPQPSGGRIPARTATHR